MGRGAWRSAALLFFVALAGPQTDFAADAPPLPSPRPAIGAEEKFQNFIREFKSTALAQGVTAETYDEAMAGIAPIPGIRAITTRQPEFVRPIWSYLARAVSDRRVAHAKLLLAENAAMLDTIQSRFGIPKEILVAIWGMETDYGRHQGSYNLFAALATEAYEGPRQALGRREMIAGLLMMQRNGYQPTEMVSSWAGAFGQTQFLPSAFLKYATDGDGDGKIDLWHSPADALASTASLLQRQGWQNGTPWGFEVTLPKSFPYRDAGLRRLRPLSEWASQAVKLVSGADLPKSGDFAALYLPAGPSGPALLTPSNFRRLMGYNDAASYALAVGLLADRMMGRPGLLAPWPRSFTFKPHAARHHVKLRHS
jgi:peptidoglycan lytic transglycosylase B